MIIRHEWKIIKLLILNIRVFILISIQLFSKMILFLTSMTANLSRKLNFLRYFLLRFIVDWKLCSSSIYKKSWLAERSKKS